MSAPVPGASTGHGADRPGSVEQQQAPASWTRAAMGTVSSRTPCGGVHVCAPRPRSHPRRWSPLAAGSGSSTTVAPREPATARRLASSASRTSSDDHDPVRAARCRARTAKDADMGPGASSTRRRCRGQDRGDHRPCLVGALDQLVGAVRCRCGPPAAPSRRPPGAPGRSRTGTARRRSRRAGCPTRSTAASPGSRRAWRHRAGTDPRGGIIAPGDVRLSVPRSAPGTGRLPGAAPRWPPPSTAGPRRPRSCPPGCARCAGSASRTRTRGASNAG